MQTVRTIALLLLLLGGIAWSQRPDGLLHVLFLPTAGDAALVQTPRGGFVLIDGGADPAALTTLIGRRMPFWQRRLEAVVLTTPGPKQVPGQIGALARYEVGLALAPPILRAGAAVTEWKRLLEHYRVPLRTARAGQRLTIGGAGFTVLAQGDGAESGLVLQIAYGRTIVVLDGMGDPTHQQTLLDRVGHADALVFPWKRELPTALLDAWRPRHLVFTDAFETDHPALHTTFERGVGGARVYHERLDGTVELISDGRRLWSTTER